MPGNRLELKKSLHFRQIRSAVLTLFPCETRHRNYQKRNSNLLATYNLIGIFMRYIHVIILTASVQLKSVNNLYLRRAPPDTLLCTAVKVMANVSDLFRLGVAWNEITLLSSPEENTTVPERRMIETVKITKQEFYFYLEIHWHRNFSHNSISLR